LPHAWGGRAWMVVIRGDPPPARRCPTPRQLLQGSEPTASRCSASARSRAAFRSQAGGGMAPIAVVIRNSPCRSSAGGGLSGEGQVLLTGEVDRQVTITEALPRLPWASRTSVGHQARPTTRTALTR
jgi:hypothetical protein